MKTLILNGSPRGGESNTLIITKAFIEGLQSNAKISTDIIDLSKTQIAPCNGCYGCWKISPGKCVIFDDMEILFQKYINAEIIIWSFPLYFYGMPSKIKAFMDRLLPISLPQHSDKGTGHPKRFDLSFQKHVLISTCGFSVIENNFEALIKQFDIIFSDRYVKILCPQGELLKIRQLIIKTEPYLNLIKQAGREYISDRKISEEIERQLAIPFFPKEQFVEMANNHWKNT